MRRAATLPKGCRLWMSSVSGPTSDQLESGAEKKPLGLGSGRYSVFVAATLTVKLCVEVVTRPDASRRDLETRLRGQSRDDTKVASPNTWREMDHTRSPASFKNRPHSPQRPTQSVASTQLVRQTWCHVTRKRPSSTSSRHHGWRIGQRYRGTVLGEMPDFCIRAPQSPEPITIVASQE